MQMKIKNVSLYIEISNLYKYNKTAVGSMGKDRTIFHIDINHCYAQIEEMKFPELRNVPMAVGGHEETRHGIILAKNDLAKKYGIKTGESLREAKQKCSDLLIIPPSYDDYIYYTSLVKEIYRRYSDHVESFGLDEAWIDYTDSVSLFGDPLKMAVQIQKEVHDEIGLDVSVGLSWNKIFAKLGSDMKKKDGPAVITRENYRETVWPLPASDLLYVGPATTRKLRQRGIYTIGELAVYPRRFLKKAMGIPGEMISVFANGGDTSPVAENFYRSPVKSVGNSMTMVHDVDNLEDLRPVYYVLCEAVASRMRDHGMEGDVISISLRSSGLDWYGCERKIDQKTDVSMVILHTAMRLVEELYDFEKPLRAVGVSVSGLRPSCLRRQLSLFEDEAAYEKARMTDLVMDEIREKYGYYAVQRACTAVDRELTAFNVKDEHTVHPIGYFQGRKMMP